MRNVVTWARPAHMDVKGYNIYRSLLKEPQHLEDWEQLNSSLVEVEFFEDTTALPRINAIYWYRITWVDVNDVESGLEHTESFRLDFTATAPMRYFLTEIVRRHNLILGQTGYQNTVDVYVKKTVGERCECWSTVEQRSMRGENCLRCLGVGFVGGYVTIPNETVRIRSPRRKVVETDFGLILQQGVEAWVTNYPLLHKDDLLLLENGDMYIISEVVQRRVQGVLTLQRFTVELLPPNHALHKLEEIG